MLGDRGVQSEVEDHLASLPSGSLSPQSVTRHTTSAYKYAADGFFYEGVSHKITHSRNKSITQKIGKILPVKFSNEISNE